jgi:hypothetical protein
MVVDLEFYQSTKSIFHTDWYIGFGSGNVCKYNSEMRFQYSYLGKQSSSFSETNRRWFQLTNSNFLQAKCCGTANCQYKVTGPIELQGGNKDISCIVLYQGLFM